LRVGGPYTVVVTSTGGNATRDNVFLELGETDKIRFIVGRTVEEEVGDCTEVKYFRSYYRP
jgi:hypothetical protein